MDPFEVRLTFVGMLHKLTSSLASIQKASQFCLVHSPRCAPDLWECILEACDNGSLNHRVNLLYLLDTLLVEKDKVAVSNDGFDACRTNGHQQQQNLVHNGASLSSSSSDSKQLGSNSVAGVWTEMVSRDLDKLVQSVVPSSKDEDGKQKPAGGHLNLHACEQVLTSWRTRRLLDRQLLDDIIARLATRRRALHQETNATAGDEHTDARFKFSKNDILRRIEDDRERHKRLRERIWVLPAPTTFLTTHLQPSGSKGPSPISPFSPSELFSAQQQQQQQHGRSASVRGPEVPIELEFEQLWDSETLDRQTRDPSAALSPQELDAMRRETDRWIASTRVIDA